MIPRVTQELQKSMEYLQEPQREHIAVSLWVLSATAQGSIKRVEKLWLGLPRQGKQLGSG